MKLIQTFEDAIVYANRLGLAGGAKTVMVHKQRNLADAVADMLKACGQYQPGKEAVDHFPVIPFIAHWDRVNARFRATVLGPGQNTAMVKRAKTEAKSALARRKKQ